MEYFDIFLNIITIGGWRLYTINRYLKQREDRFNTILEEQRKIDKTKIKKNDYDINI